MDLKPYKIRYGYMDDDGDEHWNDAEAESPIHAADILCRLRPSLWEVITHDLHGRQRDVTAQVHHMLVRYIQPAYRDGRGYSPQTHRELRACQQAVASLSKTHSA